MLSVTIARLRERWPDARIAVLTDTPALLRAYFPEAEGVSVVDTAPWSAPSALQLLAGRLGPRVVGPWALGRLRLRVWFRVRLPQRARGAVRRLRRALRPTAGMDGPQPERLPVIRSPHHPGSAAAAEAASLVLALGGGYVTDADRSQTLRVLNLLDHAHRHGVPVALIGQGLGPLDDPVLCGRAAEVLSAVDFIALRERRIGPEVLRRSGVPVERVLVTGDDAVELAYAARSGSMGSELGVCLRVAGYSPVPPSAQATVGAVVRGEARRHSARLVPLIIAEYRSEDRRSTLPLVAGAKNVERPLPRYAHPIDVARRVAQCRVVVTGAYHLAVFALSQGISTVALSSSRYYDAKFLGLEDMFGTGLTLVHLQDPALPQTLSDAIGVAWEQAPAVRDELRARARAQIAASREAFDRVFALVDKAAMTDKAATGRDGVADRQPTHTGDR